MTGDPFVEGLFFGLIGAVAVYHFLMFAVLRTGAFLAYGAYLVAFVAFQLSRAHDAKLAFGASFAALTVLGYWLFRTVLALPAEQPRLNRVFGGASFALAALALLAPFGGRWISAMLPFGALAVLVLGGVALLRAARHGSRVARFFGVAFAGLFVGALARFVDVVAPGMLGPLAPLGRYGIELGSGFQALTLALGIADRIAWANEERDRAQRNTIEEIGSLNVAFSRFVPRAFLELLGKSDVREVALGDGVEREMTVLFTDVRSFTALSEAMTPGETFGFINELLAATGPVVREHGGVVDKYVGDAIMALFPASADDALQAAIALQSAVAALNATRANRGAPPIAVGVGLHRGSLMLGTIGESERMDGTVIADAVNTASRVEGLTKRYGTNVIVTKTVRAGLADPERYALRFLGRVAVEGKRTGIGIYEVLDGEPAARRAAKRASIDAFDAAVAAFGQGAFATAAAAFDAVAAADPDDGPARYLHGRALDLAVSAVAWEGVDAAAK